MRLVWRCIDCEFEHVIDTTVVRRSARRRLAVYTKSSAFN